MSIFFSIDTYVSHELLWNVGWLLFQGDNKQPQTAFWKYCNGCNYATKFVEDLNENTHNVTLSITITTVADVCRTEFFALNGAFVN